MTAAAYIVAFVALLVGALIGWLIAGRRTIALHAAQQADAERLADAAKRLAETDERFRKAVLDLETADREREQHALALAALRSAREADDRAHAAQITALTEARDTLAAQFQEVGAKLLERAQAQFLESASERFKASETAAGTNLAALLAPVHDRLQRYEQSVEKVERERAEAYGTMHALMHDMRRGQEAVRDTASNLVNSLRNAPKARGRWGEQQLRNVLESCGLAEHVDFWAEVSVAVDGGVMRPDVVVRVPGNKSLVIDAKVSLNAYQDAFDAPDDAARKLAMNAHAASMRAHVDTLARKAYWAQFEDAPDYVIMFVPGEHFVSAALDHDPQLWDYAFNNRVLLATPTNLVAIARTVAGVWRQDGLARDAQQIGQLGKEMFERLAVAAQHLRTMGSGLNTAVTNYNKFVGSFERNVLSTGRKFAALNIDTGARELGDVPELEALPRYAATPDADEGDAES